MSRQNDNHFVKEVRRQAERAGRSRYLSFWQGLGLIGAVGWMVVLPAVAGAFAGRWLDQRFEKGIFWTLSLLIIGLALGCFSAWRHVKGQLR
ncbi:MAG: AtpZ/AtpI family protein [Blastocatellia bacterium]|nr:AtpZ/AtpI family protein [Blastocatellia bacterium]